MTIRCESCGKFMDSRGNGSSWVYVPSSELSYEELGFRCKECTEKLGCLKPNQNCVEELCCGVMQPAREES